MQHRSGRKSAAQTPAPKADQIKGSSVNAEGSASSESSASDIKLSDSTVDVLKKKYEEFREKYPRKKNITLNDLKAVYRRGSGAYSKSHRPTISGGKPNSRAAWSYARVNKFLKKAAGEPVKKAYVQDDDLMEKGGEVNTGIISLPDTYSTYENLKPILENQGYTLQKNKGGENMEQIVESLLKAVYPMVKEIFNKNGLIINESYAFTDGSNKSYLPYFSYKRTDDKIDEVKILYFEQEFEIAGELNIETKDEKIEIEVEFPQWNIDAEVEFEEGGEVMEKEPIYVSSIFSYSNPETLSDVTDYVNYILGQYASRKMAAIQVHQYLSEIELGGQWLAENNIKSRVELVSFLAKMQSKARSGKGLERAEALAEMKEERAEMAVNEIIDAAYKAGQEGQQVTCVNCNWSWSTEDSEEYDKYVCHQCGFDNTLFYENDILKPNLTVEEIAKKHGVAVEYVREQLEIGANHEMEHTAWYSVGQRIALHHLAEDIEYYKKLKTIHLKNGGSVMEAVSPEYIQEFEVAPYLMQQRAEADDVLHCSDSRIYKTMICKTKIEVANRRMQNTDDPEEKNVWNECILIWSDCLNNIVENNIPVREYKDGGQPCGCGKIYRKGGVAYGNSHDKGGIPLEVKSTKQKIEIEGGEGVVNKVSMQMDEKVEFEGKELTPCEVVSKINEMGGGVKFKCADVKEIIENDGKFD